MDCDSSGLSDCSKSVSALDSLSTARANLAVGGGQVAAVEFVQDAAGAHMALPPLRIYPYNAKNGRSIATVSFQGLFVFIRPKWMNASLIAASFSGVSSEA